MKTIFRSLLSASGVLLSLFTLSPLTVLGEIAPPTITRVQLEGTNVAVTVQVPAGVRKVTLECRARLGAGTWAPRAVTRLAGDGGEVVFRLPASSNLELMRVRADESEPLPASFYSGTNSFYEIDGASGGLADTAGPTDTRGAPSTETSREVVESDIWKIRGQTLYFFNQLRGLQVIDVSNPDAASVRGTLSLPAVGEDMYVLGQEHVVLLARDSCSYDQGQVIVARDTGAEPEVVARLAVSGFILESRLVGTALYVASQAFRTVPGTTGTWEWGTLVSSFDLSDPANPAARSTLWISGYGNVVTATDRLLFVATQDPANWWQSTVHCLDITDPSGTVNPYETIRTSGRVADKFKLNWQGTVFTSISEDWRTVPGRNLTTHLETFHLADPRSAGPVGVIKLGDLELGRGERLHATRFDGSKVYVVTFFQIDPLWVVDLSDPSAPRVAGSVDVPGWSTFIQPLGERLVTIGIEGSRVAVSLFDVANPATPSLLSRVRIGENYSYSEANWDEKAFSVLPDAGLILVPFSGDTTNGYAARVQLIDLNENSLTSRGVIEHQFQPRRATLYGDRILSISGWEYLSVDASDRDHPAVRGSIQLAWPVDRVFLHGAFVLELGGGAGWSWGIGAGNPVLRVASADSPNQVLSELPLGELPVIGASKQGTRLYLAQGEQGWYYPPVPLADGTTTTSDPVPSKFMLTVLDLTSLPAVQVLGQLQTGVDPLGFGSDWQALWPKPGLLVFSGGGASFWWDFIGLRAAPDALFWRWPPFSLGGGRLLAFDVSDDAAPRFSSDVNLAGDSWWNFSQAFSAGGLVYLSHQQSEFIPVDPLDPTTAGGAVSPSIPNGTWVSRSFLDVVDYAEAPHPVVRKPVNIPGQLKGLSHQGAVVYTVGTHWKAAEPQVWTEFLDASAYDGVEVHLIDSLALPDAWPHPLLIQGTNIFLGRPGYPAGYYGPVSPDGADGPAAEHTLETWSLFADGKLTQIGKTALASPANALAAFGQLLVTQLSDNSLVLFDAGNAQTLKEVGHGQPPGCLWFDLTRADGSLGRGLWIPLGAYGVSVIPAEP